MTLWDMLDKTLYYQKVFIYEHNTYGQHMLLFKGLIEDARKDTNNVWSYLMHDVSLYEYFEGVLVLYVIDEYYNEKLEGHYLGSDKWTNENRPWKHKTEIYEEIKDCINSHII